MNQKYHNMTYFFYPMNKRVSDDELLEALNDMVLVDAIDKDGIYVWNERNYDDWKDACGGPCRIQQFVQNELVNDVYYTGEEDEMIHLYPNKKVYALDHATDDEILNADSFFLVHSYGEGVYYDVPSEFNERVFGDFVSCVRDLMADISSHEYPEIPTSMVSTPYDKGMYFTYIKPKHYYENPDFPFDDFKGYNIAFWFEDGKIIMRCDCRDVLNLMGDNASEIEKYSIIQQYDDL